MLLNCGVGEDSWESLRLQGDPTSPSERRSVLNIHWKDWCWSWNSNTLATWCKELTHMKRPWCWGRLKAGGKRDDRRWEGWVASLTRWTWVWASSGSWWWTGKPGVVQSMGSQRGRHDWTTVLNWMRYFVLFSYQVRKPYEYFTPLTCQFGGPTHFVLRRSVVFNSVAIPWTGPVFPPVTFESSTEHSQRW